MPTRLYFILEHFFKKSVNVWVQFLNFAVEVLDILSLSPPVVGSVGAVLAVQLWVYLLQFCVVRALPCRDTHKRPEQLVTGSWCGLVPWTL